MLLCLQQEINFFLVTKRVERGKKMEELNLGEMLSYFKNKLLFIIIVTSLFFILGISYSVYLKTPMYRSTSTIIIATPEGLSGENSDLTLNQKLVDTYKEIIKSRTVIEETIDNLKLNYTYEELSENIDVSSVSNTEVSATKSSIAQDIVTELTEVFSAEVEDLYKVENIKVLDNASTEKNPYNINLVKDSAIYLAVGIIFSSFIVFIRFYFDNTFKTVEQVESYTGLAIIGAIPVMSIKGGKYE